MSWIDVDRVQRDLTESASGMHERAIAYALAAISLSLNDIKRALGAQAREIADLKAMLKQ